MTTAQIFWTAVGVGLVCLIIVGVMFSARKSEDEADTAYNELKERNDGHR